MIAVGSDVTLFKTGDRVWYAGDISRPAATAPCNWWTSASPPSHPRTPSDTQAAALPLTAITAWEALFERIGLNLESQGRLLIIGGAGGVGSIAIQLARQLTNMGGDRHRLAA